jgi:glutaredoxin
MRREDGFLSVTALARYHAGSQLARASTGHRPALPPLAALSDRMLRSYIYWRVPVPSILLLVSPSCGACPSAKSLWKQLRVKYSFSYREVDITTEDGRSLADRHSVRAVPATIIDGRLTFVGVPSRESAEKALLLKMKPRE